MLVLRKMLDKMNKLSVIALIVSVSAFVFVFFFNTQIDSVKPKESVYERVLRTGTIRCGYGIWEPLIIRDLNTGKLSGIFFDYMEAVGEELSLKIIWTDNLNWSDWNVGLEHDRYDAVCVGIWPTAARARQADFTVPLYYHAMYAYVRSDDMRFDGNINLANNESITFAGQDGAISQTLAKKYFPKAKLISLSDAVGQTDSLLYVATRKADIVIADKMTAESYLEHNKGKLKQVQGIEPISYFANTLGVKVGEDAFRRMLDSATRNLLASGTIDKILNKYEKYPNSFLRIAKPYKQ